jgi:hypothetical protein
VAILTDGLADVLSVNGAPPVIKEIGGLLATRLFEGSVVFGEQDGKGTLTRGQGADLGSFSAKASRQAGRSASSVRVRWASTATTSLNRSPNSPSP